MKILILTQYPLFASTTNRMLGFAKALQKRGHKVTFLVVGNKYLPGVQHKPVLPTEMDGVLIKYTPSIPNASIVMPGFLWGMLAVFFVLFIKTPIALRQAFSNDVIYSSKPLPYGAIITILISFFSRKPFVLDLDDWEGVGGFATIKQSNRAFVKAVITYFEEKTPLLAKSVVSASSLLAKRVILGGVPANAVFIAQNGADILKFNPGISGESLRNKLGLKGVVLCYLGTFKKGGANWEMLVNSFAEVCKQTSDAMLLVIGFGDQLDDAKTLGSKLGLANKIVFAGKVEHGNVAEYLATSDIFLLPYQDDFPDTFVNIGRSSVKLYEYMAMGKAIIATDVGEVGEALANGAGVLVKTNDPIEFGSAIVSAIKDKDFLRSIGEKARRRAEEVFNYEKMSEKVENALLYAKKQRLKN